MRRGSNWVNVFETPCIVFFIYLIVLLSMLVLIYKVSNEKVSCYPKVEDHPHTPVVGGATPLIPI